MSQDSKLATGDRAIHFWLKLSSGEASEADHAACRSWRAADPTHERAWARLQQGLEQSLGRLEGVLKQEELRRTLIRPARRRVVLSLAGLAGAAGVSALLADRVTPLGNLLADLGTATAERRRVTLPDGSLLTLDARSRVDLHFSATARTVHLLAGAVLAQPSPSSHPLFAVSTPHGRVQSAGAGYMVRLDEDSSLGVALQDGVDIVTRDVRRLTLAAGSGVRFGADWIGAPDPALAAAAAWREGWLKAQDQALGEVVATLARYRKGVLRVSSEAARIPVSGLYPLDDTDRALSALAHTLPIRIRRLGPWLTLIDTRSA